VRQTSRRAGSLTSCAVLSLPGRRAVVHAAAVPDPGKTVICAPERCGCCGEDLAGAVVTGMQRLQEFDITPPPPPVVTEYQVQARECGRCGAVTTGQPPRTAHKLRQPPSYVTTGYSGAGPKRLPGGPACDRPRTDPQATATTTSSVRPPGPADTR